jgi:hypothetical protein
LVTAASGCVSGDALSVGFGSTAVFSRDSGEGAITVFVA